MNAVQSVITPKLVVMQPKKMEGPTSLIKIVAGSWKVIEARVRTKIDTLYRFPSRSRSCSMDVTEAEEMIPESNKLRLHKIPAIVHNRTSIFQTKFFSS